MQEEMYSCKEVVKLLSDYIEGECSPEVETLIDAHLADCPDCIAFVNTFRKSMAMTKALNYSDIPDDVRVRLRRVLGRQLPMEGASPELPHPPSDRSERKMDDKERY